MNLGTYLLVDQFMTDQFHLQTARMAADAMPNCENYEDLKSDSMESECNGETGGAVLSILGAVAALVAAVLCTKTNIRVIPFVASIGLYALGLASYNGGLSASSCESDDDVTDDEISCNGYGSATSFFLFAFIAAAAAVAIFFLQSESRFYFSAVCFVFLGLYSIGQVSVYATWADGYCTADSVKDDQLSDSTDIRCSGNSFAAAMMSFAMVVAFAMAGFIFVKKYEILFFHVIITNRVG